MGDPNGFRRRRWVRPELPSLDAATRPRRKGVVLNSPWLPLLALVLSAGLVLLLSGNARLPRFDIGAALDTRRVDIIEMMR